MKKQLTILFLFLSVVTFAQEATASLARIDSLLNHLNEHDKFMGSLCIMQGDEVVFKQAYGYSEATKGIRANGGTKYKIGSITKTFTAAMIMQLVDEKKILLTTKLSKFFPKIENADKITIEQLLYQRTGIRDYTTADATLTDVLGKPNMKELIFKKIENYPSTFEPNSKHENSNSNYYVLGLIIEKATKKSYAENLKIRITDKLGLKNTYYTSEKKDVTKRESYSYTFNGEYWDQIDERNNDLDFSSGGIISTPEDLTQFIRALFKGNLVSPASFELMKTLKETYGMALIRFPFGERKFFGHNGRIEGFEATMGYYQQDDMTISFISNGVNYSQNDIMLGILSIYYKSPYRFPVFETLNPEKIKDYVGTYASTDITLKVKIFEKNGELYAQATGQPEFPLTYASEDLFYFQAGGIEMDFSKEGFVLKQGQKKFNFTKE
ncbi:beta-lactamase family protein [Flavobacterium sp. F372]|uniref:Beta-lactamase family protein n=1 Tax=Flavobacterium bernardetii TaxID=2813823 RepID=A0ABR7J169_9FLAO|nr:serine hydrolase domain-containing protein [Flavobacterium bernardetii]MBC5835688.1 beta-lactamase family protein [Flavobacterium bernardetii]NHF71052.1 beta-lactamase family protein [Flavobacterium bernardetii]